MSENPIPTIDQQTQLETHRDFILMRRFGYSLQKAVEKYPDGLPDNLIAQALGKPVIWVQQQYNAVVNKLRDLIIPEEKQ